MSNFRLQWTVHARVEARHALERYVRENPRAGERLHQEIRSALAALRDTPRQWAVWRPPDLRRQLLERLPYFFVYSVADPDLVTLVAFLHQHQDPSRRFPP